MTDLEFTEEARGGDFFSKDGKDKGTWRIDGHPGNHSVQLTLLYVDGVALPSDNVRFIFYTDDRIYISIGTTIKIELAPIVIAKAIEFFRSWNAKYPNVMKNVD